MNDISVTMALVDFLPVLLFFVAAFLLLCDLYNKLVKGAYALLASGAIMVLFGGMYKASWKILYALGVSDYRLLNDALFPLQAPGFLLVFLALASLLRRRGDTAGGVALGAAGIVPAYSGSLPFVIVQTIGCGGMQWCLFAFAMRMKKPVAAALYALAFLAMLAMGYLSSKFDNSSSMHWVAQTVNILSQGAFLGGTVILHRAGLAKAEALAVAAK